MRLFLIFLLWVWGLTPLWFNIVGTIFLVLDILVRLTLFVLKTIFEVLAHINE